MTETKLNERISRNLARVMAEKRWSMTDLAHATGCHRNTISAAVHGYRLLSVARLLRVATVLGCEIGDLLKE